MTPKEMAAQLVAADQALGASHQKVQDWLGAIYGAIAALHRTCPRHSIYFTEAEHAANNIPTQGPPGTLGMFLEVPATKIRGLVKAAIVDAQSGNLLRGLHEAKNDTCIDILDQANFLCEKGFLPAAAVLAGGALETHHKDLCIRNNIAWGGDGSISTYDSAIAQARNKGTLTVYESGDTKLITAWGDDRNCAAHRPTEFKKSKDAVELMIAGVRQFLARVP